VSTPASICVDDDLAASETAVALRAADGEKTGGVHVVDGLVVKVLGRNNRLDDLLLEVLGKRLLGVGGVVLGGDHNGVYAEGAHGAVGVLLVLNRDLGLSVGAEEGHGAVLAHLGELVAEAGGERVGEGHHLLGLVSGIAEHVALVASSDVLRLGVVLGHSLADLHRLTVELVENLAGLVVETLLDGVEANLLDGLAHNGLVVDLGVGGDLTEHHHEAGAGASLAGNAGLGVLREAGIDDGIGDLVGELVGVTLVHRLGGEEELALGVNTRHSFVPPRKE
jgi:hypothetical protein